LNGVPAAKSIPPATQERIFAAARQFNYRPNVLARSLRRGHSMTIGVLLPEISEGYATLVLAGLEQGLLEAGYAFLLCSHHHRDQVIERSQIMLAERAVDGIVAIDTLLPEPGNMPLVTVSCPLGGHRATDIVLNHERAAGLALEHLAGQGHRSIAFIKGQRFSSDTAVRWKAICHTAERLGLVMNPDLQTELQGDAPTHEPGFLATQRLLSSGVPFTALFAFNDVSAIGAIRALREAGLSVPGDISVVGFDDIQSAAYQNPALTTVRQPLHHMGRLAAEAIVGRINAKSPQKPVKIRVEPELLIRESTAPVRSESPHATR
jgi:LacI family transcriptional regulator